MMSTVELPHVGSASRATPLLFSPIQIRGVTSKNRIMFAPMAMYSLEDGIPSDWHLVHLGSRAIGGAGIVMAEASAIAPEGRVSLYDAGLWNDAQAEGWKKISAFVREHGSVAGIQLAHGGRKAAHTRPWEERRPLRAGDGGWPVVGPSPLAWAAGEPVPSQLTKYDIGRILDSFAAGARRAFKAGFNLLEVHGAHGYLMNQFLSPISNQREDEYGGDFEGRIRFCLELVDAVRSEWPSDLPLFVRVSASEWVEGGWGIEDTVELAKRLKDRDVDMLDCSSGGTSPLQNISAFPGYQLPLSHTVREETGLPTVGVGLIYEAERAEEALQDGDADIIAIGRIGLWDPYWPIHAAVPLGVEPGLPVQYARSAVHLRSSVARADNKQKVRAHF
jgi:2,4-dienoyl-CoA reductase-like NADH-dependent reductase (Old Yellow Enzyme family)